MTKAEQEWSLIEALVYCKGKRLTKKSCAGCPYAGAGCAIDATIAKLKAQEPRVMTLEDLKHYCSYEDECDRCVWVEYIGNNCNSGYVMPDTDRNGDIVLLFPGWEVHELPGDAEYSIKWRCWTSRPTDERREAEPWQ